MLTAAFTALALAAAARPVAAPPVSALAADAERVVLTTEDKLSLIGSYWAPKGKQMSPGAILVHGAGGKRGDLDDYAARLSRMGFAVLSIDLRGHGESATADLDWSKLDREGQEHLWAFAMRDLKAGAEYLRAQKDVHSAALTLLGLRSGGTLVTRHAVRDENVRCIALLDPPVEESQMFGFHLSKDIESLGGLPTRISVSKDVREQALQIAAQGQSLNGGLDFINVTVFKGTPAEMLQDTREAADVCKWIKDHTMPSKGSR